MWSGAFCTIVDVGDRQGRNIAVGGEHLLQAPALVAVHDVDRVAVREVDRERLHGQGRPAAPRQVARLPRGGSALSRSLSMRSEGRSGPNGAESPWVCVAGWRAAQGCSIYDKKGVLCWKMRGYGGSGLCGTSPGSDNTTTLPE